MTAIRRGNRLAAVFLMLPAPWLLTIPYWYVGKWPVVWRGQLTDVAVLFADILLMAWGVSLLPLRNTIKVVVGVPYVILALSFLWFWSFYFACTLYGECL